MYDDIKDYIEKVPAEQYRKFKGSGIWNYIELGNKLKSWAKFRRAIFTTLETEEDGQLILEFARPDTILYTNLGQDAEFTEQLKKAGKEDLLTADSIKPEAYRYFSYTSGR